MDEVWRSSGTYPVETFDRWCEQLAAEVREHGSVELAEALRAAWVTFKGAVHATEALRFATKVEAEHAMVRVEELQRTYAATVTRAVDFINRQKLKTQSQP